MQRDSKVAQVSDKKMDDKIPLELQIKGLEKSMVTLVKAFKEIKATVGKLEEKVNKNQSNEIQEIMKAQQNLEIIIAANTEAIKRIDNEILRFQNDEAEADAEKKEASKGETAAKMCKYYNRGHCKYKLECRFKHPEEICENYLGGKKCYEKACKSRHPKVCKWWQDKEGCKRNNCDYLHVTLVRDDDHTNDAHKNFPCAGCQNCFDDRTCVVEHVVRNNRLFLCLNCDDWIQKKEEIMNNGWSLYDQFGNLRRDV